MMQSPLLLLLKKAKVSSYLLVPVLWGENKMTAASDSEEDSVQFHQDDPTEGDGDDSESIQFNEEGDNFSLSNNPVWYPSPTPQAANSTQQQQQQPTSHANHQQKANSRSATPRGHEGATGEDLGATASEFKGIGLAARPQPPSTQQATTSPHTANATNVFVVRPQQPQQQQQQPSTVTPTDQHRRKKVTTPENSDMKTVQQPVTPKKEESGAAQLQHPQQLPVPTRQQHFGGVTDAALTATEKVSPLKRRSSSAVELKNLREGSSHMEGGQKKTVVSNALRAHGSILEKHFKASGKRSTPSGLNVAIDVEGADDMPPPLAAQTGVFGREKSPLPTSPREENTITVPVPAVFTHSQGPQKNAPQQAAAGAAQSTSADTTAGPDVLKEKLQAAREATVACRNYNSRQRRELDAIEKRVYKETAEIRVGGKGTAAAAEPPVAARIIPLRASKKEYAATLGRSKSPTGDVLHVRISAAEDCRGLMNLQRAHSHSPQGRTTHTAAANRSRDRFHHAATQPANDDLNEKELQRAAYREAARAFGVALNDRQMTAIANVHNDVDAELLGALYFLNGVKLTPAQAASFMAAARRRSKDPTGPTNAQVGATLVTSEARATSSSPLASNTRFAFGRARKVNTVEAPYRKPPRKTRTSVLRECFQYLDACQCGFLRTVDLLAIAEAATASPQGQRRQGTEEGFLRGA